MIWKDLKASSQCIKVAKTANQVLYMIKRMFTFEIKENLLQFYKSLVTLHIDYMQVCSLISKKDIDLLVIQHRSTKIILGYYDQCYKDRLALWKLSTLKCRRLRGDLIVLYVTQGFRAGQL